MRSWILALPIFFWLMSSPGHAQSGQELFQEGIGALQSGDFAHAERTFAKLVKQDPSGKNLGYLAVSEARAGDLTQAITHFQQAIEHGNNTAKVHYNLGLAFLQEHQRAAAIREFRAARAKDPDFQAAQRALALALLDEGQPVEAIPYLEKERARSPKDPEVWVNLVHAQFAAGHTNEALRRASEAAETIPNNVQLVVLLGDLCLRYQQPQKARYLLENASEMEPDDSSVKLMLAKASLAAGESVEALAALQDLPNDTGEKGEVPFLKGVSLGRVGKSDEAAKQLASAITADPDNANYLVTWAWLLQLEGHYNEALATLGKARKLQPLSPVIPYASAVSYFLTDQFAQAAQACEEAIRLSRRNAPSYLMLGMAKLQEGDLHGAQIALRRSVTLQPELAFVHRELGVALFKGGDLRGAGNELNRALGLDQKDVRAYFWRALVLEGQGQRKQAIADLETAVALQPLSGSAFRELARLYRIVGDDQKASEALAKQESIRRTEVDEDRVVFLQQLYKILPSE